MRTRLACGRRSRLAVLAAAAVTAATLIGATPANADSAIAVTNPSFIQPYVNPTAPDAYVRVPLGVDTIPGWRVTNNDVDVFGRAASKTSGSSVVDSGSQAVDLNGSTTGGIEQTIRTEPGSVVTITFAAKINDHPFCATYESSNNQSLLVQFAGNTSRAESFSLGTVATPGRYARWQLERAVLPATGRHSRLQFLSTNAGHCGPLITDIRATDNTTT
ncbi:DUF642 domain-containing protein [Streptomyces sp. NPDC048192]|uniref:DUF642 domain-containing protein n=1 Tax=Streptomyces sp. NPDC048192 TaxID=3365510 RepID=UPI00371BCBB2